MSGSSRIFQIRKIGFQNVASKQVTCHYSELENYIEAFLIPIVDHGYTLKGPFFYSLNNVPINEVVSIEMFFPIVEGTFEIEDYEFHSYFELEHLMMSVVTENFQVNTEQVYAELLNVFEERELDIVTPFFHIFPRDKAKYVEIYLGYKEKIRLQNQHIDEISVGF